MRKCTVNVSRLGLTVLKGSVVYVDEQQYKAIEKYVSVEPETATMKVAETAETPEKPKRRRATKSQ